MNSALARALSLLTDSDYKHLESCDKEVRIRRAVEIAIIRKLASTLLWSPYRIEVDDGGEYIPCATSQEVVDAVFAVDESRILLFSKDTNTVYATIIIVLGNDGWDCINDYSTKLEDRLKPVNEFAEELAEWL